MRRTTSSNSVDNKIPEVDLVKIRDIQENEDALKKRKYPGFRLNFLDYCSEFCNNTGIHGFFYMGERDRSLLERLCWLVSFSVSLYFCIVLCIDTWNKWEQSPVLVSFARSPTPVWQIPFPAVTICSETKARQSKYNFTEAYDNFLYNRENVTEEELAKYSDIGIICDNHLMTTGKKNIGFETIDFLMEVAPDFHEVFYSCKWTLLNESCSNLFTPMLTEEGLCFTFNMLDKSELLRNNVYFHNEKLMNQSLKSDGWTLEDGYPKTADRNTFPRRAMSAGFTAGLNLVLRAYQYDLDYICRGPVQGFKVLLHHPAETPRVGSQYFRVPLNQEVVVSVKPDMMTTSQVLRGYHPYRRQCFFPSERYLSFFQSYTQQNCEVECLTNHTLAKCGCVAYHMPHEEGTPLCGSANHRCMFAAQSQLLEEEVDAGLSDQHSACDCLPACTSLVYNAESSQADFNWMKLFQAFRVNPNEDPGVQLSRVTLFFKEQQFITSERNELYGQTDFLANCGGILGLFTGFSFLSIVEIIYFMTLRVVCNIRRHGRHFWSASPDLLEDDRFLHTEKK